MFNRVLLSGLLAFITIQCIGNAYGAPLEELREKAQLKEAEARKLAQDSPCYSDDHCDVLIFKNTDLRCDPGGIMAEKFYKVYTHLSPTAAQAKAAMEEQREAAEQARLIQRSNTNPLICPAVSSMLPGPVCVANKCVVPVERFR